ncbi:MAG: TonB family protein [Bacteroidia bacterium]
MRFLILLFSILFATQHVFAQAENKTRNNGRLTNYYKGTKKKASSGKYKQAMREGVWTYWREDGSIEKTETYHLGMLDGVLNAYHSNGELYSISFYQANMLEGKVKTYYTGNRKESELNYVNNKLQGEQMQWFDNGNVFRRSVYEQGELTYQRTNYLDGRPQDISSYLNGSKDGVWRKYPNSENTKDTLPEKVTSWKDGKLHGTSRSYYRGVLVEEIEYVNGQMHGHFQQWDYTGLKTADMYYADGLKDGLCTFFNMGIPTYEGRYNKGLNEGMHVFFARNGLHRQELFYNKYGRIDSTITYYQLGKVASRRFTLSSSYGGKGIVAVLKEKYEEYNEEGVLLLQGYFINDAKEGEWKSFYATGAKKSTSVFVRGELNGKYEKWYSTGKKMIEFSCRDNSVVAEPKVWDAKGLALKPNTSEYEETVKRSLPDDVSYNPSRFDKNKNLVENFQQDDNGTREGDQESFVEDVPVEASEPVEIFQNIEEEPSFPGGKEAMMNYIGKQIRYPALEKEMGIQGTVYVSFVVLKDGKIDSVEVLKGVAGGAGLDKEAIRVVTFMPPWTPGRHNGKPVNTKMTLPIKFALQ